MTGQNKQPQEPPAFDKSQGNSTTSSSSWTANQPVYVNSISQQPEPFAPTQDSSWTIPSRPMPAAEYQKANANAQLNLTPLHELSISQQVNPPAQVFPVKRHRMRTF